ncbi:hypothetical protein BDW02DRAFT_566764 [Decorospora gaudefroyi]|uniref:Restriction of telomere capping protein 4 n=1 Tax=Decorospora gaudefroyi TaxID=184978 RepID=A0A6A5KM45_9PLEO|nr:hypothetical protein BDW02DRAFT_566764 [Decorospora gaudefroyi]
MPLLGRNAPKLLGTVSGKRHASYDDHEEEPVPKRRTNSSERITNQQTDSDVNAEPMESSDEELHVPAPRAAAKAPIRTTSSKTRGETEELRRPPQRKSGRKNTSIPTPVRGAYQAGQAHKTTRKSDENKENAPTSSNVPVDGGRPIIWSMEAAPQRKEKKDIKCYGSKKVTQNLHAAPTRKFGRGPSKSASNARGAIKYGQKEKSVFETESGSESGSEMSMMDDDKLEKLGDEVEDAELPRLPSKTKRSSGTKKRNPKPALLEEDELSDVLRSDGESTLPRNAEKTFNSTRLLNQLNSWKEKRELSSSQPENNARKKSLENFSEYMDGLPEVEEEGSRCTLCAKPVAPDDYWDFWKGKKPTAKNLMAFCTLHKKLSAQKAYTQAGYPDINWTTLPTRIHKHKTHLTQILNNDRPSGHRARYEPLALTGKAAAVPSRRTDLSPTKQAELNASYALNDDRAAYPGYYGPHGRRLIAEIVIQLLNSDIKHCTDPAVQASGIAAFAQAVLVPETALLLIMEDCGVDIEQAEGIRQQTFEMGVLVHEEVEDELERGEDSEDENEYQDRGEDSEVEDENEYQES